MNRRWIPYGLLIGALTLGLLLLGGVALILPAAEAQAAPNACVPGPHSGTITANETWCLTDSPHLMAGDVWVAAGVTLTIEPGVTVMANGQQTGLIVQGRVEAPGTATQPITFTSVADNGPNTWEGLFFYGGSGYLRHATVRYGGDPNGDSPGEIFIGGTASLWIESSRVVNSSNLGIFVSNGGRAVISDTLFSGTASWPLIINGANSRVTLTDNSFTGNTRDRVLLQNAAMTGADFRLVAQKQLQGYELGGDFWVPVGITMTIGPGVTVMADGQQTGLMVQGRVEALGTATQPITFTSVADNAPNTWEGLFFYGGSGYLRHATVRYGGDPNGDWPGEISIDNTGFLWIESSRVLDSSNLGIFVSNGGRAVISDTLFSGIASWPLIINGANSRVTLTDNSFTGNTRDRVLLQNAAMTGADFRLVAQKQLQGYELGGDFWVPVGITMTIGPGVTVMANGQQTGLMVQGRVEALGTAMQPITFTSVADNAPNSWEGLFFYGGSGYLRHATVRYGGDPNGDSPGEIFIGGAGFLRIESSRVVNSSNLGIFVSGGGQLMARNTVFADNAGNGLVVAPNARATLLHSTIARNGANGVYVDSSGAVTMTNSIIAGNATGVRVVGSGQATLNRTLWDHNVIPTAGPVNETGHLEGLAQFALDGYHITRYSAALEQGVNVGVTDDLDGQPRPLPAGTAPDLGADEYPYSLDTEFVAEKAAFAPQWIVDPAHPYGRLQQRYLIRYYYGSADPNPPALTVSVTDTLPTGLAFQSEWHTPAMAFQQQGQRLTWQTTSPVQHGQSGQMQLVTVYDSPQPGRIFINTAELRAGEFHFDLQAAAQVPVAAPLIVSFGNGEMCLGTVVITGTVPQADVTVTLYANDSPVAQAPTVNGIFTASYNYAGGNVTLRARACGMDGLCSAESNAVILTPSQSFWCPRRSTWEGTPTAGPLTGQHLVYQFRDNSGNFSTRNWVVPGVYGFWNTTLHLYVCNCPPSSGVTTLPSSVWVIADGVRYDPSSSSAPWYTFAITGGAHSVRFYAQCGSNVVSSEGTVLIDPDGYVFDVTQGFTPTLHAVSGVTVTAYVSMPQWGGWVPWPAHLYNNQINPQVTGNNGYFAFFTPPGYYYLQVEGKPGYQSWRSPVIQVVNEIVHVNVPLTPWTGGNVAQVTLNPAGPSPTTLNVPAGSTVEWRAPWDSMAPPAMQLALVENPMLRLLSARNPLSDTLGFDGGMLAPGGVYRRQFNTPGTYPYSDGLGHTATIVVGGTEKKLYLPFIVRHR